MYVYSKKYPFQYHLLHHYPIGAGLGSNTGLSGDKPAIFHA